MITTQPVAARRSSSWANHALEVGELGFLAIAVATTSWGMRDPLYSVLVSLGGLVVWLLLNQPRHHVRRLTSRKLVAPTLTAIFTLLVLAVLREPYSGMRLLFFTFIWTAGMIWVRLVLPRYWPPVRVLLLGRSSAYDELFRREGIYLEKRGEPPESLIDWDVIAIDGETPLDTKAIQWLSHAGVTGQTIINAHNLYEELTGKVPVELLDGHYVEGVFNRDKVYIDLKRALDLVSVIVFAPAILLMCGLVAVAVLLDAGRPVLFWQDRIGRRGTRFRMVKFRTMSRDAESGGAAFATDDDRRITRVGRFLRKVRFDELPQFWNVLLGQMSIVGPRPEQVPFAHEYEQKFPLYRLRHSVAPGITGWAQVTQGYAAGADETLEKLRFDIYYIKHLSLATDVKVLLRTVATIVSGYGAR